MKFAGFVGPTYQSRSRLADCERCINLIPEKVEANGKASLVYYAAPGREAAYSLPDQPVRQMFQQNGRVFAISGSTFYELFGGGSYVAHGTVANGSRKPRMASNGLAGNQVFITAGGFGYIFNLSTNTLTQITDADFPTGAGFASFADGYFLVLKEGTLQFNISDLEDGTAWDGLDIGVRSQQADNLACLHIDHDLVWLFGSQTSEVWYNSGAAAFPFDPVPNVFLEQGLDAPDSVCSFDNGVAFLGKSKEGARMVFRAEGFNPVRISNHALETALSGYARTDDAQAFVYQDGGHTYYQLTFPTANATWVYDASTQMWHERGTWNSVNGQFDADRASCHVFAFGMHLVGDRNTGTIYRQAMDIYADGDAPRRWLRRTPHLSAELTRIVYHRFQLNAEVGVGLNSGQGSDPQVMLRWSDDGAFTWSNEHWRTLGAKGDYRRQVLWYALGQARDRVFEVSGSDPVKIALIDAYLDLTEAA
jgi:hypothetical protein